MTARREALGLLCYILLALLCFLLALALFLFLPVEHRGPHASGPDRQQAVVLELVDRPNPSPAHR